MLKVDTFHGQPVETYVATLSLGRFKVMGHSDDEGSAYFDVFVEGRDESVASLRLDEDEGTVTFYDPEADEGTTVFEADPDDDETAEMRTLDALVVAWHRVLQSAYSCEWGWDLFEQDATGFWTIQRDDDRQDFDNDIEAIVHVKGLADEGHKAAQLALGIHYHPENGAF